MGPQQASGVRVYLSSGQEASDPSVTTRSLAAQQDQTETVAPWVKHYMFVGDCQHLAGT